MIKAPQNNILVTVKSKYSKDFGTLTKRFALNDGTSIHMEDLVTIVGTVASLPIEISQDKIDKGFSMDEIMVGDEVIFSFNVIYDFFQKEAEGELFYKNRLIYNGRDYWMADITKIFGIIREGKIIMINGYIMATPFVEDKIFVQAEHRKVRASKSSELMWIGNPRTNKTKLTAKQGDTIYYNPKKAQRYQINDKPFIILTQQQILGRKVN